MTTLGLQRDWLRSMIDEVDRQLSRSYATLSKIESDLDMTTYGMLYKRLTRATPGVMGLVP